MIAIIVAYKNGYELEYACNSLHRLALIDEIFVVDNSFHEIGSCFDAIGYSASGKVKHIIPPANLGYAGGNNLGLSIALASQSDRFLICNPDVVVEAGVLSGMDEEMTAKNLDLISPFMLEPSKSGESERKEMPGWDSFLGRGVIDVPTARYRKRFVKTFYGACFIVTRRLLESAGLLCEDFFLYGEEIDYCKRLEGTSFNWEVSSVHGVAHSRASSISPDELTSGKSEVSYSNAARSMVIVGRKYWPIRVFGWSALRVGLFFLLLTGRRFGQARAVLSGLRQGWAAKLTS